MEFKDQVALITGSTSGIGEATARILSREGVSLMLTGRDNERGENLCKELTTSNVCFSPYDLKDPMVGELLISETLKEFSRIDILVNSAGVAHHSTVPDTSDNQWEETMAVNLTAVFLLCRAAIPAMIRTGGGTIINVASTWGLVGAKQSAAYCASKGAVVQLTRAMATDHAQDNIRVNAICPGAVDTPMLESEARSFGLSSEEGRNLWASDAPNNQLASAEDIANSVLFLASSNARHIHGAMLTVDGGATAFY